jgi:hypothetical protein
MIIVRPIFTGSRCIAYPLHGMLTIRKQRLLQVINEAAWIEFASDKEFCQLGHAH